MSSDTQKKTYTVDLQQSNCYHCGDDCTNSAIKAHEKDFCCQGCVAVFELLAEEGMDQYYCFDKSPGLKTEKIDTEQLYKHLDLEEVKQELFNYRSKEHSKIKFFIPQIHCSSCIWLLENLHKLNPHVAHSEVNFGKKEVTVSFSEAHISLKEVAVLLATVGYPPRISAASKKEQRKKDKSIYYKIGIAGFCFGNIMLLSFPQYLGIEDGSFQRFEQFFSYLIFALSIPVVAYCATDYISSAVNGLAHKNINIDVPISIGIAVLFARSSYEVFSGTGAGYFDSLSGLIFFLLIGKWYQAKIYDALEFERDYKSYFPIAVTKIITALDGTKKEVSLELKAIKKGDVIVLRNEELIPADSELLSSNGRIDYSFVTGEADPVKKCASDYLYAGGKQIGERIEVKILKEINQSYLTSLWNQDAFKKGQSHYKKTIDQVSRYFTIVLISISFVAGLTWYFIDSSQILNVVTSILIIACPCALALTIPFTLGNAVRQLGKRGFYAKSVDTVEQLSSIDNIVFDKTGTITDTNQTASKYIGIALSKEELIAVKSICSNSAHPLSQKICSEINKPIGEPISSIVDFKEVLGKGLQGFCNGVRYQIGSAQFVQAQDVDENRSTVYVKKNEKIIGYFQFESQFRTNFYALIADLKTKFSLHLLSGDGTKDQQKLKNHFPPQQLMFNQSPLDKLKYIQQLQLKNGKVLMLGDGLNDAGALKQSDVGIAISDNVYAFSPACDGILAAHQFEKFNGIIKYAKACLTTVHIGFTLSFLYNVVGISLAVSNLISPVISAILMPISSITIVLFSKLTSNILAKKLLD